MNRNTPINYEVVTQKIKESGLVSIGKSSIREVKKLVDQIEKETGDEFVRMEMGIPGLPPTEIGVKAEIEALENGVAAIYADIYGIAPLKKEAKRFVKLFLDVDVAEESCIPSVGAMQGGMVAFMTLNRMNKGRGKTLFIDPGFPIQKLQHKVMGLEYETFDVYDYRGDKLKNKIESYLQSGTFSSMIYSNPNNPSWICFTEKELKIIGELATKYDVIAIEDLAYIGMDFRKDYSVPGKEPYQPTVARYSDNWLLLISSSKVFSYAGQRIGLIITSDKLFNTKAPDLKRFFDTDNVGYSMIFGVIYTLTAGVSHSAQYALTAMLKAVNDGDLNLVEAVREYGDKAKVMKKMFIKNGFNIVYDMDEDKPIADGFYFTFSYPGFTGVDLLNELIYYGISAISLAVTGSKRLEGIRACVSLVRKDQFPDLEYRLKKFHKDHPIL